MSECSDKKLGQLLHDYELGLLSEEDNRRFEIHMYDCDYCLNRVRELADVSKILKDDPDVRAVIKKAAEQAETEKHKKKHSPFMRILIAAVFAVVIFIPAYKYLIHDGSQAEMQILELLPARTGGDDVIYLEKGGNVQISFYVDADFRGQAELTIAKVDGDTIISRNDFSRFNGQGLGTITLPVSDFTEGHYMLHIIPISDTARENEKLYLFRVK